ncbi:phosphonatase-like hydrolase [uncultured Polaribacter sp.]|uniref:phosphonatase-like hydrolase n=1 Tax=uncultured Polaribacter sp. TaxID=174711 RepID=UPI0026228873|nr:phosphonatase-like hydrolase [uncultured Polaribacter sp.]
MIKKIDLVVFDMAGTTVNEDNVVYKTLQKSIHESGYNVSLYFVLKHGAGKEKHQAIKDILAELPKSENQQHTSEAIFKKFKIYLDKAYTDLNVTPCIGVASLFPILKEAGIKIALNTGYNSNLANMLLDKLEWKLGIHYDALITASDVVHGRPNPDMIYKAMKELNVTNSEKVLKAGDSIIDIEEGKNASCGITVGVTTGAHSRAQLKSANPTYVLDSLLELTDILI